MCKKHFAALAVAISGIKDAGERGRVAQLIGNVCASCNGKFNWSIWRNACGV